jgi:hypothetical protein
MQCAPFIPLRGLSLTLQQFVRYLPQSTLCPGTIPRACQRTACFLARAHSLTWLVPPHVLLVAYWSAVALPVPNIVRSVLRSNSHHWPFWALVIHTTGRCSLSLSTPIRTSHALMHASRFDLCY